MIPSSIPKIKSKSSFICSSAFFALACALSTLVPISSLSTKYFDIYILKKSLKINHLEEEWEEFLKGYNIDDYNEIYIKWMELIEISYN